MKTALIVLNYNDFKTTSTFLNKIKNFDALDLIVVVDNNSTDFSYKLLLKYGNDKIKVIKTDKNGGYGYGNNFGIKYAIKKLGDCNIIISNPDVIISEKTIKELIKDLNANENYAIIGPKINTAGVIDRGLKLSSGIQELLISIPVIGKRIKKKLLGYKKDYYKDKLVEVGLVSGCCFVIKSKVLERINFFDENVFLYYEENIISKKIMDLKYKIMLDNELEVIHNHSISIDKSFCSKSKFKILKKSQMYYLKEVRHENVFIIFFVFLFSKLAELNKR